jgi:ABC-type Mn2+/Zn2+ transport system permease subunit
MDIFGYTFMQRALIEAVIIGGVCAVIGVYVVLNSLSFIGAGISHATFAGIALGFLLGVNPTLTAVVFVVAVALAIGEVRDRSALKHDTIVGVFFAATMAFGILVLSFLRNIYVDIFGYLFGNILAVSVQDMWISAVMAAVIFCVITVFYKELTALSFDSEMAAVIGIPVRGLNRVLLTLIALTVVLSVKAVGVVLVSALIVIPAATAYQLTRSFRRMMVLSLLSGEIASVFGLLLSYWFNIPSGAAIVLLATLMFFAVWAFAYMNKRSDTRAAAR